MKTKIKKVIIPFLFSVAFSGSALAMQPLPNETGFSGFVNLGAGVISLKSNVATGSSGSEFDNERITSIYDGPDDAESKGIPVLSGEVKYTFANIGTQLFLGNRLEDFLKFDSSFALGARKSLPGDNIVSAGFLFSGIPASVWEDPYVVDQKREPTDRTSKGARIGWDRIMGTDLEARMKFRKIEIDNERSGLTQLGLAPLQAKMLNREGNQTGIELAYNYSPMKGHVIVPTVSYDRFDLDGDAMANDQYMFQLSYGYNVNKWSFLVNGLVGVTSFDEKNPIYDDKQDETIYGAGFSVFYHKIFDVKGLGLGGNVGTYRSDSDIDFYDTDASLFTLSAIYTF